MENKIFKHISNRQRAHRFLIIRDGLLGDIIFLTPVIYRLSKNFPNSIIDIVVSAKSKALLENFPGIKNIYTTPEHFSTWKHFRLFFSLRKNKYDVILVQEVNTHFTIMSRITGARIILGYNNKLKKLHSVSVERKGHAVKAEQQLINLFLGEECEPPLLFTTVVEKNNAENILLKTGLSFDRPIVCIQVTCSHQNSIRQLPDNSLSELADMIVEKYNAQIIFTGVKDDSDNIEKVRSKMRSPSFSLAGKTSIRELISILQKAKIVIGPDTGTLHIADAVGTPVIMYMGFADPDDTGPFGKNKYTTVVTAQLDCIPCKFKDPKPLQWEYCKINRPAKCMELIQPQELLLAVDKIMTDSV